MAAGATAGDGANVSTIDSPQGQRVPWLRLWVNGDEVAGDVVASLRVEERVDRASTLSLVMASSPVAAAASGDDAGGPGDWDTLLRGPQAHALGMPGLALLSRVSVGFTLATPEGQNRPSDTQVVFDGFVTSLEHRYAESRASDSELVVEGMDASYLMHVETVSRRWEDLADHEIARQIYASYGFASDVEETPRRNAAMGSMQQRCTDAEFVRQLARRHGLEAFVTPAPRQTPTPGANPGTDVVGHFRAAPVGRERLTPANLFHETAPTLVDLTARCDAERPTTVRAWHIDEQRRVVRHAEITEPDYEPGSRGQASRTRDAVMRDRLAEILGSPPRVLPVDIHTSDVPHDHDELQAMALGQFRDQDWFASAQGTVAASRYEAVVRAGTTMPVTGAGPIFDGDWYVRAVIHRWGAMRQLEGDPPQTAIGPAAEMTDFTYEVDVELARTSLGGQP